MNHTIDTSQDRSDMILEYQYTRTSKSYTHAFVYDLRT